MVAGAVLAGAPLLAFDYWLARLIERQSVEDVTTSAKRAIALAETRVGASRSTRSTIWRSRREVVRRRRSRCDAARQFSRRADQGNRRWSIRMAERFARMAARRSGAAMRHARSRWRQQLSDRSRRCRRQAIDRCACRRQADGDDDRRPGCVPGELFVPQVSTQAVSLRAHASMATASGTVHRRNRQRCRRRAVAASDGEIGSPKNSASRVAIAVPQSASAPPSGDLEWLGLFAKIAVGLS